MILRDKDVSTEMHTDQKVESKDFGMDEAAMAIIFRGFSDSLYSNKIGSIVREITSNAFDSHAEAGVTDKMVRVAINEDILESQNTYFEVEDYGVGLSPERIDKVYTQYGASTKRDTNNQIGGFGIGAKSPLSYADSFMLITRFNGTEYHYLIHRGETAPRIDLVDKVPTDSDDGTKVMIPIKNEADMDRFKDEIESQLRYFENIYYQNCDVENDFKLYKGSSFVTTSNKARNGRWMHLCIGRVYYPLDTSYFTEPDIEDSNIEEHFFSLPVAIHCEIGDVSVTMSRESIEYTENTIKHIQGQMNKFAIELRSLIEDSQRETDDILEYIRFQTRWSVPLADDFSLSLPYQYKSLSFSGIPGLEEYNYSLKEDVFFFFEETGRVVTGKTTKVSPFARTHNQKPRPITTLLENGEKIYRKREEFQKRLTAYLLDVSGRYVTIGTKTIAPYEFEELTKLKRKDGKAATYDELKKASEIYFMYTLKYLLNKSESYEDQVIPASWLDNYKKELRTASYVLKDKTGTFNVKTLSGSTSVGALDYRMQREKWSDLLNYLNTHRVFVYCGSTEKEKAEKFYSLVEGNKSWRNSIKEYNQFYLERGNHLSFALISQENVKTLKKLGVKNTYYVDDFYETKMFKDHLMDVAMTLAAEDLEDLSTKIGSLFSGDAKTVKKEFKALSTKLMDTSETRNYFSDELDTLARAHFNFYAHDVVVYRGVTFQTKRVNKLIRDVRKHAPWAFNVSYGKGPRESYESLVEFFMSKIKSTLLYG